MKLRIVLKDPDGVYNCIDEDVSESLRAMTGISDDERDVLREHRREEMGEAIKRWVEYGEYVTIEIDTDAGTAVVVPCK
jgi:hypothetical protein